MGSALAIHFQCLERKEIDGKGIAEGDRGNYEGDLGSCEGSMMVKAEE